MAISMLQQDLPNASRNAGCAATTRRWHAKGTEVSPEPYKRVDSPRKWQGIDFTKGLKRALSTCVQNRSFG